MKEENDSNIQAHLVGEAHGVCPLDFVNFKQHNKVSHVKTKRAPKCPTSSSHKVFKLLDIFYENIIKA